MRSQASHTSREAYAIVSLPLTKRKEKSLLNLKIRDTKSIQKKRRYTNNCFLCEENKLVKIEDKGHKKHTSLKSSILKEA